jgi:hypothetical protein
MNFLCKLPIFCLSSRPLGSHSRAISPYIVTRTYLSPGQQHGSSRRL